MKTIRVATLQLNPSIGAISDNIKRADLILAKSFPLNGHQRDKPDLLILPELGLTGYNFASPQHIKPFLESSNKLGPTLTWAREVSLQYGCYTVLGYPEKTSDELIYNSAIVFDQQGEVIHNYRKSFLYETDEKWGSKEGPGFQSFTLMDGVKATIGICMDLNPYKFEAPFQKFEFGNFCRAENTNLIICPTAWLHGASPSILEGATKEVKQEKKEQLLREIKAYQKDNIVINKCQEDITAYESLNEKDFLQLDQPDYTTLNYWILRFFPFVNHFWKPNNLPHKTTVILNNRSGIEDDVMYCGSSTIFQFYGKDRQLRSFGFKTTYFENSNVRVLGALGKGSEGILIRDVEL